MHVWALSSTILLTIPLYNSTPPLDLLFHTFTEGANTPAVVNITDGSTPLHPVLTSSPRDGFSNTLGGACPTHAVKGAWYTYPST